MAEIINLRRARKTKARAIAAGEAEVNRVAFGRSKSEKRETAARNGQADRFLDGHRRCEEEWSAVSDPDDTGH